LDGRLFLGLGCRRRCQHQSAQHAWQEYELFHVELLSQSAFLPKQAAAIGSAVRQCVQPRGISELAGD
jgi:hypothetical protein